MDRPEEPSAAAVHPIVGLWSWDIAYMDRPDANLARSYTVFHADGTFVEANPFLEPGLGVWTATGERTADLLAFYHTRGDGGGGRRKLVVAWGPVAVNDAGYGLTFDSFHELGALDGTVVGTGGQIETAVRITVASAGSRGR